MKLFRSTRWLFLAMILCLVPASSFAGVFISVGFAPPVLPVYEQPPCPEPGWMWTPGYWAYGDDGYYWVPGTWVPAPYDGALWTPPYWGWSDGLYVFHPGYWGRNVGYYGGVDYGFGYLGIGFVGGRWHGRDFEYNRAYMHVDERRIHDVYDDRGDASRYMVARDSRVSYSGGPGGIRHDPSPQERAAMHEQHMGRTSYQTQHVNAAMSDHNSYFNSNHGRPSNVAVARPLAPVSHGMPNNMRQGQQGSFNNRGGSNPQYGAQPHNNQQPNQGYQNRQAPQSRPTPQYQPRNDRSNESRPSPQYQPRNVPNNESRPAARPESRPESRPAQRPESRPESRPAPRDEHQSRPESKDHKKQ
ncbi:MAG: hypothetical protein WCA11_15465 [Terracidiphilus sp.]